MFKYLFYLLIIASLTSCRVNSLDLTNNRASFAKENDELAECKVHAQFEKFYVDKKLCNDFESQNENCATFPETKQGCTEFLNSSSYAETKYFCSGLGAMEAKCTQLVHERLWYKFAFDFKDNGIIKNALRLLNIDLDEKWNELISEFDMKIRIAAVAPGDTKKEFHQGIELATEQINKNGGVLGRLIELVKYDQHAKIDESKNIAHQIIADESIVAVIGGQTSLLTKPVTKIYERGGVLNLITSATNMDIINKDMKYTFRMIPHNKDIAEKTVEFCKKKGYKQIAVISEREGYAEELSNYFYNSALDLGVGISINYFKTFFKSKSDFVSIISEISEKKSDAVYFSGRYGSAARFIVQLRSMNVKIPVIGTESLDADKFVELAGSAGEGIVIPSIYNEKSTDVHNTTFQAAYKNKYGVNPNMLAVQGYDALSLLASTMQSISSTVPEEVSSVSKLGDTWTGAGGDIQSDKEGGIKKNIFFKQLHLGEYKIIDD